MCLMNLTCNRVGEGSHTGRQRHCSDSSDSPMDRVGDISGGMRGSCGGNCGTFIARTGTHGLVLVNKLETKDVFAVLARTAC